MVTTTAYNYINNDTFKFVNEDIENRWIPIIWECHWFNDDNNKLKIKW